MTIDRLLRGERIVMAETAHSRQFDNELIVLDLGAGAYFALDEIGTRAWQGFAAGKSAEEIASDVAAEYDIEFERALQDILTFADELLARGLFTGRSR